MTFVSTPLRFGHHMQITDGSISSALIIIHRLGGSAIQIALGDMSNFYNFKDIKPDEITKTKKICEKYGYYVVVHGKYIYNFCRSNWPHQLKALLREMNIANSFSSDVIIHQGKNLPELKLNVDDALKTYAVNITDVLSRARQLGLKNKLILENSARQGNEIGYSIEHLAAIYQHIPVEYRDKIAFCIDTCHAFVAGELDLSISTASTLTLTSTSTSTSNHISTVNNYFNLFDTLIGLDKLAVVHLNDSKIPFNGRNDSHAGIGKGHIDVNGLKAVTKLCCERNIPVILETPSDMLSDEMRIVSGWSQ